MKFVCPAKTFIFGEYIALLGGPTLIATTKPDFELHIDESDKTELIGIHPNSPAGKFYQSEKDFFAHKKISFHDPYHGLGGYGASSAQFVLLYRARYGDTHWQQLLNAYHQFAWNGEGIKPSGADVIAQATGDITEFFARENILKKHAWPFSDAQFSILHTQKKLATHEHLKNLSLSDLGDLEEIALQGIQAFKDANLNLFCDSIQNYQLALSQQGWLADHSRTLLDEHLKKSETLAAKACGAMGADTILTIRHFTESEK